MKEVKLVLQGVLHGDYLDDTITLLTTTPESSLDELLVSKFHQSLQNFRLVRNHHVGERGIFEYHLVDTKEPAFLVLIASSLLVPTSPASVLNIKTTCKYRHQMVLDKPYNRG